MRFLIIIILGFIGCTASVKQEFQVESEDTTAQASNILYDSVCKVLPKTEKAIKIIRYEIKKDIEEARDMVDSLKKENEGLKQTIKITKSVIIHDTIYIKEKTNFWGKKKVSVDSSSSVTQDSTIIENK